MITIMCDTEDGWVKDEDTGSWYYYSDGEVTTGWRNIDGDRYYFNYPGGSMGWSKEVDGYYLGSDGKIVTSEGWVNTEEDKSGTWYYVGANERVVTGWNKIGDDFHYFNHPGGSMTWRNTIDGFQLDDDGKIVSGTGWLKDEYSGEWYYFSDGEMKTGWVQDGDSWYYLKSDGTMATGSQNIDGDTYYFYSDGEMGTGWEQDSDNIWHYFYDNGSMAHDLTVGGYHVDKSGKMITGTGWVSSDGSQYYLKDDGEVVTDWLYNQGNWYYLYGEGSMAHDTTVDGYYLNDNGEWVANKDAESGKSDANSTGETSNVNQIQNLIDGAKDKTSDAVDWTKNNYKELIDYVNDKVNSTGAAIVGSSASAISKIKRVTKAFINEHNLIQLYPDSSIVQTIKPFKKIANVGTFITAISSTTQIITTWTDDSNNTFEQKLKKSGIQAGGTIIAIAAGSVNTIVLVALGAAEPETAGGATAGMVVAVTIDVAEGEGIQAIQKKLYEKWGIEDK